MLSGANAWGGDATERAKWLQDYWESDNGITKRLAGIGVLDGSAHDFVADQPLCPASEFKTTEETFKRAKDHVLNDIDAFIIQEFYSDSLVLAERKVGLPPMFSFLKAHFNPSPAVADPVPDEVLDEIEAWNVFDKQIYDLAVGRFKEQAEEAALEIQTTMEARRIIDDMLHISGGNVLTVEQAGAGIGNGINDLLAAGKKDTVLEILRIMIRHPAGQALFLDSLLQVAESIATPAEMEIIRDAQEDPYSL